MMPFSTSLEVITEESQNCPRETDNKAIESTNDNEAMSQRSLVLLQQKDEELKTLQMRIRNLEQMTSKFENRKMETGLKLMQEDELEDKNNSTEGEEYYEKPKGTLLPRRSWQLLENECTEDSCYEADDSTMTKIIQSNNLQLKKELLSESRMRLQDRKQFIEVLDKVHETLKDLRAHPDITPCQEFVELATKWFRRECSSENETDYDVNLFETSKMERSLPSLKSFDGIMNDADKRILKSSSSTSRELFSENEEKETKLQELATRVDSMIDSSLVMRLDQIRTDLNGLQLVLQSSKDRVTQERRIQQVAQSAWRARFDIQLKTIKRLETRYQKVCRCLMKFRRRVKNDQRPEKKLKKNKKTSPAMLKDGLSMKNDEKSFEKSPEKQLQNDPSLKKNEEATAFLEGRLKAVGIVLTQNRTRIQQLSNEKKALEKEVLDLKQELLRVNSNKVAMSLLADISEKDSRFSTSDKNTAKLAEQCELLSSEIITLKDALEVAQVQVNVLKDEKSSLLEEKKTIEVELSKISQRLTEMEDNYNQKLTVEKSKVHAYEQKFSEFYKQSGLHVQEARERISTANKKLREFFKMIQIFLEKVDDHSFAKCAPLTEAYEVASSFLNSSMKDLELSNNYNKWINHCRALAKNEHFAEEMAEFLFTLVGDKNSSKSDNSSNAVEVGSIFNVDDKI
ncbi:hypothetical protein LSTR_LSTR011353 [Laodelphax striatellus]|uniref:Uncharacterized protein n=1 Tax=Laodelphax striatellus TaxID=195883 RepID=A0A482XJM4_LAOST|nr:hypothetical protein LSTR_LSTR011353 [Laodelphax striatellus]